jgi:hypothetical protein
MDSWLTRHMVKLLSELRGSVCVGEYHIYSYLYVEFSIMMYIAYQEKWG